MHVPLCPGDDLCWSVRSGDEASRQQALQAFETARNTLSATCTAAQQQLEGVRTKAQVGSQNECLSDGEVTPQALREKLQRMTQLNRAQD